MPPPWCSSPSISNKKQTHLFGASVFWCERRDEALLCKSSLLGGPLSASHPSAEKQSPGLFSRASGPLGVQVPPFLTKNKRTFWCVCFLVRETGLEPVWMNHTPLKRARLPVPPLSRVQAKLYTNIFSCQAFFCLQEKIYASFALSASLSFSFSLK